MNTDTKIIVGSIIATVIIIFGAALYFNKSSVGVSGKKVDNKILIKDDSYQVASSSAKVTLVEFADYQCPACASYQIVISELLDKYNGVINYVYRNFPLTQHKNANLAAQAAEAAGKQGKFWEMHDFLYKNQNDWAEENNAEDKFIQYAKDMNLNTDKFKTDLKLPEIKQKIEQDIKDGYNVQINSTPTFFLDGEKLDNLSSLEEFKNLIDVAIKNNSTSQYSATSSGN